MKRKLLIILSFLVLSVSANARHIFGGEMSYSYIGPGNLPNTKHYKITLKLFKDNAAGAALPEFVWIGIFDYGTKKHYPSSISHYTANKISLLPVTINKPPCVVGNIVSSYSVATYSFTVDLPDNADGYICSYQTCCRIGGITNVSADPSSTGSTYACKIPGTNQLPANEHNSSPQFVTSLDLVCKNSHFDWNFSATDADGDSLVYSFTAGYDKTTATDASATEPTSPFSSPPPDYPLLNYQGGYFSTIPLGTAVNINSQTGIISGVAPEVGNYVTAVYIKEYRNGIFIAEHRKDFILKVEDCDIPSATLSPRPATCDGFTVTLSNETPSSAINTYFWDFGVTTMTNDTSNLANPTFTYSDTGVYTVKLITNRHETCSDSATTLVRVYPGFFPGFSYTGSCYLNPFDFTDNTTAAYGVVDGWSWNFGDNTTFADTSHIQNPQWLYSDTGPKKVLLTVSSSKGCMDTTSVTIDVLDKPLITMGFTDTLICTPDNVQLNASGMGNFSWTPNSNINNPNIATPTVNPTTSTWYYVRLDANGCINTDSVHVRVVKNVTLMTMPDTTICLTDPVQLRTTTDGLRFQWTPSGTLNDPTLQNPIATPNATTTNYQVTASVGSCSATDNIIITTVPYPIANAGPDQTICYNTATQLNASQNGSSFSWTPISYLSNPNILNPIVTPPRTTTYILASLDTLGCPKPGFDTITVTVQPKIIASAGRDTSIVIGQPLQLQGSGGITYIWSPPTGLSNTMIPDPIATLGPGDGDSIRYKMITRDASGCPDSAYVTVYIFKTNPYIFVPTAFTPNNDGKNDVIRPIAVGVEKINYFSIYNRWGERIFTTTQNRQGWDGRIGGVLQASNVYVWMVSAVDYTGKTITLKGTVTLIR